MELTVFRNVFVQQGYEVFTSRIQNLLKFIANRKLKKIHILRVDKRWISKYFFSMNNISENKVYYCYFLIHFIFLNCAQLLLTRHYETMKNPDILYYTEFWFNQSFIWSFIWKGTIVIQFIYFISRYNELQSINVRPLL